MTDFPDEPLPEWTDDELGLLQSARRDGPGPRSLQATLSAAGAAGAVATGVVTAKGAALTATTAKWSSTFFVAKWVGIVALGGTVVTGSVAYLRHTELAAPVSPAKSVAVHDSSLRRSAVQTATPPAPPPEEPVEVAPAETPETKAVIPSPGRRAAAHAQPDISAEIASLDEARAALRGGRPTEALTALDRYSAATGKSGSLRVEATTLRIEALLRSGHRDRAEQLAGAFLAHNPNSPYAARIRALLSGAH
jgi:hypothetical protein